MIEMKTSEETEQKSTEDGTVSATLLSDGSKKTKEPVNSHNESRLIAWFKDRSCCIFVCLSVLLIISFVVNIYFICKEVSQISYINLFSLNRNIFLSRGNSFDDLLIF